MTTTAYATKKEVISKKKLNEFLATAMEKIGDSIGDMVITVAALGIWLAYLNLAVHPFLVSTLSGYVIAAMIVQLLIRIVHRFDDSYTNDELAAKLQDLEDEIASLKTRV